MLERLCFQLGLVDRGCWKSISVDTRIQAARFDVVVQGFQEGTCTSSMAIIAPDENGSATP